MNGCYDNYILSTVKFVIHIHFWYLFIYLLSLENSCERN